jgi:hypothetical protein
MTGGPVDFEGHRFTDGQTLLDAARASWSGVWLQPRGDAGDATPLAWLARLGAAHPEWRPQASLALAELLLDGRGLDWAALFELRDLPWDPLPPLAAWIVEHAAQLAARPSAADSRRSLMGELVGHMGRRPLAAALPDALADLLIGLERAEDGHPDAALCAMAIAPARHLGRLPALLESQDEPGLTGLVEQLLGAQPAFVEAAFVAVGRSGPDLRRRVAAVVRSVLERAARRVEAQLADPALDERAKALLREARGTHAGRIERLAGLLRWTNGRDGR